jgi:hypothetical protein
MPCVSSHLRAPFAKTDSDGISLAMIKRFAATLAIFSLDVTFLLTFCFVSLFRFFTPVACIVPSYNKENYQKNPDYFRENEVQSAN